MQQRLFAFLVVFACLPVLQGAGCTAHYSAHIHGKLHASDGEAGKRIVVIFRKHEPGIRVCTKDWAPCMTSGWQPLHACNIEGERGKQPSATIAAGSQVYDFDACTGMIGVYYRADIAAFIDDNANGRLDKSERYGVYEGSPLSRDMEESALPLSIDIQSVMP